MNKYGSTIVLHRRGVMVVINGYMFSVFVGCNTNKLQATFFENVWRKTKTPRPKLRFS